MTCTTCEHPALIHKDGAGMCLHVGCMCNLFRGAPPLATESSVHWYPLSVNTKTACGEPAGVPGSTNPENTGITCRTCLEAIQPEHGRQHIPPEFIMAMNAVFEAGVKGDRVAMDWQDIPRLTAANKTANLYIHMDAKEYAEVACNALILWWHFQRTKIAVTIVPGNDKESDHEC